MKNILFPFLVICALSGTVSGQELDSLSRQSLGHLRNGETALFEASYPGLYNLYLKENLPEYGTAVAAASGGQLETALHYLRKLIEEDIFIDELESDENFLPLHGTPGWARLMQDTREIKESYIAPVRRQLKDIQERDQGIRLLYLLTEDDSLRKVIHEVMETVDRRNAVKVSEIIDRYGWLGPREVGLEGNETLFLAIQHVADTTLQQKYLPMLRQAVDEGCAEGWHLAFLTDRLLMNRGEKQVYGTQKIVSPDPARSYIVPLLYPDMADRLRAEIGMEPLADELAEEGITWDLQQYLDELLRIENMYRERNGKLKNEKNENGS